MSQRLKPKPIGNSLGSFAVDLITSLGGKPTPQSRKLFSAWQRMEGGWTNNDARFNPLNLTAPGSGFPTINSVGVVSMPSYQVGVKRTADLLSSGYPALAQALRTGQVSFQNPAVQADLNRWLSGKRTPGVTPYVSKIASAYGANVPAGAASPLGGPPIPPSPPSPQAPPQRVFDEAAMGQSILQQFAQGGGRINLGGLPGIVQSSFKMVQPPPQPQQFAAQQAKPGSNFVPTHVGEPGKGIALPWNYKSTHETDGLQDEGFTRAIDIMGSPGTPVTAPQGGTVIYFHPTGAQGGGSMLVRFKDGREGWIGHIENGLAAGTKFGAGSQLADISPDHPRPHVHWSLR